VMLSPTLNMPRERLSLLWMLSMLSSVKVVPSMVSAVKCLVDHHFSLFLISLPHAITLSPPLLNSINERSLFIQSTLLLLLPPS
jgi:hypothetical protein